MNAEKDTIINESSVRGQHGGAHYILVHLPLDCLEGCELTIKKWMAKPSCVRNSRLPFNFFFCFTNVRPK